MKGLYCHDGMQGVCQLKAPLLTFEECLAGSGNVHLASSLNNHLCRTGNTDRYNVINLSIFTGYSLNKIFKSLALPITIQLCL